MSGLIGCGLPVASTVSVGVDWARDAGAVSATVPSARSARDFATRALMAACGEFELRAEVRCIDRSQGNEIRVDGLDEARLRRGRRRDNGTQEQLYTCSRDSRG